jgi:hypothetical protein
LYKSPAYERFDRPALDQKLKGVLFLVVAVLSSILLILEQPTLKAALLLALSVWCFCRFYYFAFYVIEHYVDPAYRFSGLWSFGRYLWSGRGRGGAKAKKRPQ